MDVPPAAWFGYHGWLPALIPAEARTFRVSHDTLAQVLAGAGAEIIDGRADVEIAEPDRLSGDGALAIVTIEASREEGGSLLATGARRSSRSIRARFAAARVRRRLRAHGYGVISVVPWDIDQFVHLPGGRPSGRRRLAEYLPQRALVVGRRGDPTPTVLEAVAEEVGRRVGRTVEYGQPLARQGLVIALADEHVLRVAVGPGRLKIEQQQTALTLLAAANPPQVVAQRVPRVVGVGRLGLGDWSAEERLPGTAGPSELSPELLADCIDFLVALHGVGPGPVASLVEDAETVAALCRSTAHREVVLELGRTLDAELAHLPRGFGHGDFWTHNLLVADNRLRGVIDWDSAMPGRLPLLDLVHLRLSAHRDRTREYLGPALVRHQIPWAEAGGDEVVGSYCRRLRIEVGGQLLRSVVLAYWLDRIAFELRFFPDRAQRPVWMHNNVEFVLETLARRAQQPSV